MDSRGQCGLDILFEDPIADMGKSVLDCYQSNQDTITREPTEGLIHVFHLSPKGQMECTLK